MNHAEIERWYRLRNIKKASQVIIMGAVLSLLGGFGLTQYLKGASNTALDQAAKNGQIRIENFVYSSPGVRPWSLKAANAVVSHTSTKIRLTNPTVIYEGGKGGKIYLTAKTGELDKSTSRISGQGLVTIHYKDMKFTTGKIDYFDERMRAETSSQVCLETSGLSLTGTGLSLSLPQEEIVIENNVRARLYDVKWVGAGQRLPI